MNLVILKGRLTKSPTLLFGKSGTIVMLILLTAQHLEKQLS